MAGKQDDSISSATSGDDLLMGSDKSDTIDGLAGNDQIDGLAGNDHLAGGDGDDALAGGDGNDHLEGGEGQDNLDGGDGNDHLAGDAGDDTLLGGEGNDKLEGGAGNDVLRGDQGNDNLSAGDGDDEIIWKAGDGKDNIDGGDGTDSFTLITSDTVAQTIHLSVNSDGQLVALVDGEDGAELVLKDIEDFRLQMGQAGASLHLGDLPEGALAEPISLSGGDAGGVIDSSDSNVAVKIEAGSGSDTITGGNAADQISGGEGEDLIEGGPGDDVIDAGVGDDTVIWSAGDGNDVIDGGEGFDSVDMTLDQTQPSSLSISADADGNVILVSDDGTQLKLDGVEDIVINAGVAGATITIGDLTGTDIAQDTLYFVGSSGADSLDASATDRRINAQGNGGNDTLLSGSGNDILDGGDGDDTIDAGSGSGVDTVLGGAGSDSITVTLGDEQDSNAIDIIDGGADDDHLNVIFIEPTPHDLFLRVRSNGDGSFSITSEDINVNETVRVTNVEGLTITAGEGALNFSLESLADTSLGANGVDFAGSVDADYFDGGSTDVRLHLRGNGGDDTLIGGSESDTLVGGDDDDSLSGEAGDDYLLGGSGDDVLNGGQGFDTADYTDANGGVTINLGIFTAQNTTAAGNDTLVNIERVVGSSYSDSLVANDQGNTLEGGAGDDTLTGGSGFDFLNGGDGNDTLVDTENGLLSGDAGNDYIDGTAHYENDSNGVIVNYSDQAVDVYGNGSLVVAARTAVDGYGDTDSFGSAAVNLHASYHADHVTGSSANQVIWLRAGDDTAFGLDGNDNFFPGSGDDEIDGGDGFDFVSYQDDGFDGNGIATQGITANLATGVIVDGFGGTDQVSNIEGIIGSELNDTLTGDANANRLYARGGDDTVYGGGGNDVLLGWSGNDDLNGEAGDDLIIGDADDDVLSGGSGSDTYRFSTFSVPNAAFGHDTITDFDTTEDILDLSIFDVTNMGDLQAMASDDGTDTTITIDGDRSIKLQNVTVSQLSAGNFIFAEPDDPGLSGTPNNDLLIGTPGNDSIFGLAGNDRLEGLAGNDTLDGGDDADTVTYEHDPAGVNVNLALGTATDGYGDIDTLLNIESVQGTVFSDTIIGDANNNVLFGDSSGGGAADIISGGDGDDIIIGGPGIDTIDGGQGLDILFFTSEGIAFGQVGLTITFESDGTITAYNPNNGETESGILGIEGVVGSIGTDTITGNAQDNFIQSFYGSSILDGGAGNDTVFFTLAQPPVVNLEAGTAYWEGRPWFGTTTLLNFENVIGNPGDDRIYGDSQDNILEGINGNDVLRGGAGDDVLNGGASTLISSLGNPDPALDGFDIADYSLDPAGVSVNLLTGSATDGWGDNDTLMSINGVIGSNYNDTLIGDGSSNSLDGFAGNDVITTGAGADTIVLRDDAEGNVDFGLDVVTDFNPAEDSIDLRALSDLNSITQLTISQDGPDTLITFDAANILRLSNVAASALANSNFKFAVPLVLNGTEGNDTLNGGEGNDLINGFGGNDQLFGNDGNDFIDGGAGGDNIRGGNGNDTLNGGADWDNIWGEAGNDVINTNNGSAQGGPGNDTLTGVNGLWDDLSGDEGDDVLVDPDNSGFLAGGPGNDMLDGLPMYERDPAGVAVNMDDNAWDVFGDGTLILQGRTARDGYGDIDSLGAGAINLHASYYDDYVQGSAFSQYMFLRAGNDTVFGFGGDDNFFPGSGDDYIDGGDGGDNVNYRDDGFDGNGVTATQGVVLNLGSSDFAYDFNGVSGIAQANTAIDGFGDHDTLINIENVHASELDDVIVGSDVHNWLWGDSGNDQIYGMGEGDNLIGYAGDDHLDGGEGDWDTAWYHHDGQSNGIHVNLADGLTYDDGFGNSDTLVSIENVEGSQFDDLIIGNAVRNNLNGNEGDDVIYAGGGQDNLDGRDGADQLFGEDGDDWMHASAGDDLIDGGSGRDTVTYDGFTGATMGISLDMNAIVDAGGYNGVVVVSNDGFGGVDYLRSVERIHATDYNDSIAGNADDNDFFGAAGNDILVGGGGNDNLFGEDDFDVLQGGDGNDFLDGGENDDTLTGGDGFDTFRFSRYTYQRDLVSFGEDVITDFSITEDRLDLYEVPEFTSLEALQSMAIQDGSDVLISFASEFLGITETNSIRLKNISLADLPAMNISFSPIMGTEGNDTLVSGTGGEQLLGLGGDDVLSGNGGNDYLDGGPGNDILDGGAGFDSLHGGPGNDVLDGGADFDTVGYRWSGELSGVSVNLTTGVVSNDGFGGSDSLVNIENVEGSRFNDSIVGNEQNNSLAGNEGDDQISGGGGFDNLRGGPGNDVLDGGADSDTAHYRWSGELNGIAVNLAAGVVTNDGFGDTDTLTGIENIEGSIFADTIIGDDQNNFLSGQEGNDVIDGAGGSDYIRGGAGTDTLNGGADVDTVDYRWSGEVHGVTVNLATGTATDDGFGDADSLANFENVVGTMFGDSITGDDQDNNLSGQEGGDVIQGGAGNDGLNGDDGDDSIDGGPGNDFITGGRGSDTIDGGDDWDTLGFPSWTGVSHGVHVNFALNSVLDDGTGAVDSVVNIEGVNGSDFDDDITGDSSNNYLHGQAGNDRLSGGGGFDTLAGGPGNDVFVLSDGDNVTIPDFATGPGSDDVIDLQGVSAFSDFAGVIAAATEDGSGNTNIALGGGNNLHLAGIPLANLHADDFLF